MRFIAVILSFVFLSFAQDEIKRFSFQLALDDLNFPHNFTSGDTIFAAEFQANDDTLENLWNRTMDSIDTRAWDTLRVNNIKSNPTTGGMNIISDSVKIKSAGIIPLYLNSTGVNTYINFQKNGVSRGTFGWYSSVPGFSFIDSTGSNVWMVIKNASGNVGINTTNPTYRLDVAGRIDCDTLSAAYLARDTAFACSLYDGATLRDAITGTRAMIIGKIATIFLPFTQGTITAGETTTIHMPTKFRSPSATNIPIQIKNNSVVELGLINFRPAGHPRIKCKADTFLTAGDGGMNASTVTIQIP